MQLQFSNLFFELFTHAVTVSKIFRIILLCSYSFFPGIEFCMNILWKGPTLHAILEMSRVLPFAPMMVLNMNGRIDEAQDESTTLITATCCLREQVVQDCAKTRHSVGMLPEIGND